LAVHPGGMGQTDRVISCSREGRLYTVSPAFAAGAVSRSLVERSLNDCNGQEPPAPARVVLARFSLDAVPGFPRPALLYLPQSAISNAVRFVTARVVSGDGCAH